MLSLHMHIYIYIIIKSLSASIERLERLPTDKYRELSVVHSQDRETPLLKDKESLICLHREEDRVWLRLGQGMATAWPGQPNRSQTEASSKL